MLKQAIWVMALVGRHLCEGVLDCYETRPDMDDPLPDTDCGLAWIGDETAGLDSVYAGPFEDSGRYAMARMRADDQ